MITLKRALFIVLGFLLISFVGAGVFWLNFTHRSVVNAPEGIKFTVPAGATYKTLSVDLYNQRLISHPVIFNILVRFSGDKHKLKAGEYLFPYGSTPHHILKQIIAGTGLVYHSFTIIPGSTFKQVRLALNTNSDLKHTSSGLNETQLLQRLGISYANPEGLFFPDTYYFASGTSDLVVLKNAYEAMQAKLNEAWQHKAPDLPFKTAYEVLIAASIVEKETGLDHERPIIAAVLENRLKQNMLLQFDPTVVYGLGERYTGKIYLSNLQEDNPYNTYVQKGLPPTPICMPSAASIFAIIQPDHNDYLYFVAKGNGSSHQFSRTLAEHNLAVLAARKMTSGYFNTGLIHAYLVKIIKN